jgi:uncharacterized protein RhaS with RHS repeats
MNRYYASNLARFLTPDPYGRSGEPNNPQSWNRYAYVANDPVNKNDPSGLDDRDVPWTPSHSFFGWVGPPGQCPPDPIMPAKLLVVQNDGANGRHQSRFRR